MFQSVHKKLESRFKFYRDWHKSGNSSIGNACFFLLFSLLLSGVVWMSAHPEFLKDESANKVLGVSVGPSNLSYIAERVRLDVTPIGFTNDGAFTIMVTTSKDASVWAEYDGVYDNLYKSTSLTNSGFAHTVKIYSNELVDGGDYVYKIGAVDSAGNIVYSRNYMFGK